MVHPYVFRVRQHSGYLTVKGADSPPLSFDYVLVYKKEFNRSFSVCLATRFVVIKTNKPPL